MNSLTRNVITNFKNGSPHPVRDVIVAFAGNDTNYMSYYGIMRGVLETDLKYNAEPDDQQVIKNAIDECTANYITSYSNYSN